MANDDFDYLSIEQKENMKNPCDWSYEIPSWGVQPKKQWFNEPMTVIWIDLRILNNLADPECRNIDEFEEINEAEQEVWDDDSENERENWDIDIIVVVEWAASCCTVDQMYDIE